MKTIIIAVFVFLLGYLYINYYKQNENFLERTIIDVNYINKLNSKDKIVRNLHKKNNIMDYYYSNITHPDNYKKKKITNLFEIIDTNIKKNNKYKKCLEIYFNVYEFDKIENNFPHTHHNNILLPKIFSLNSTYPTLNTLLHEKIHILQRFKKDMFYNLYENYWNFKKKKINNLNIIEKYSRTNPDGINNNWVFTGNNIKIVLLSIYKKKCKVLSDVTTYGIYLDSNYNIIIPIKKKKINEIPEFVNFFGYLNGNNYHPNEISADILSYYLLDNKNKELPSYRQIDKWWNTYQ